MARTAKRKDDMEEMNEEALRLQEADTIAQEEIDFA